MRNRKSQNLNEELYRIKSLFGDERLYGNTFLSENINQNSKTLIKEQPWRKFLIGALEGSESVGKSIAREIRTVDPKIANKFINYEINSFSSIKTYFSEFDTIWKSVLSAEDLKFVNDVADELDRITSNPKRLENLRNGIKNGEFSKGDIMWNLPKDQLIREMFYDLWDEVIDGKPITYDKPNITITKKGDETFIHKTDGDNIETKKIEQDGSTKKVEDYDRETALKDIEEIEVSMTSAISKTDGSTGSVNVRADSNPDVSKGEILEVIDLTIDKATGKPAKPVTFKELTDHLDKNKGSFIAIKEGDRVEFITDLDSYDIRVETKLDADGNEVVFVNEIKEKGSSPVGSQEGVPIPNNIPPDKRKWYQWIGAGFRVAMPQTSSVLYILDVVSNKVFKTRRLYSFERPSFANLKAKDEIRMSGTRVGIQAVELAFRAPVEHIIVGTIYGYYKGAERGLETTFSTRLQDYADSWLFKYQPVTWPFRLLIFSWLDDPNLFDNLRQHCVDACEKTGVPSGEIKNSQCYTDCVKKVNALEKQYDNAVLMAKNYAGVLKQISDLEHMGDQKKYEWCTCSGQFKTDNADDCEKTKLIKGLTDLKESQEKIREEIKKLESEHGTLFNFGKYVLEFLGLGDEFISLEQYMLSVEVGNGKTQEVTTALIDEKIGDINDGCESIINPNSSGGYSPGDINNNGDDEGSDIRTNEEGEEVELVFQAVKIEITGDIT